MGSPLAWTFVVERVPPLVLASTEPAPLERADLTRHVATASVTLEGQGRDDTRKVKSVDWRYLIGGERG